MKITRIKAENFKTYVSLDLDLSVKPDRPIILIGGMNGGGKTTLFEAIYGALYGISIGSKRHFYELWNVGLVDIPDEKKIIKLEIAFSGRVLDKEYQYILTRNYYLHNGKPEEVVHLNMHGTLFKYGPGIPQKDRDRAKLEVDRIIKGNLPRELSRYFMFDAMESGNLLKADQLNKVIRDNVENVMGFRKYDALARQAELLLQKLKSEKIEQDNERQEYERLSKLRESKLADLESNRRQREHSLQYSIENKSTYEDLMRGKDEEATLKSRRNALEQKRDILQRKITHYRKDMDEWVKSIEEQVGLPQLATALGSEIKLFLDAAQSQVKATSDHASYPQLIRTLELLNAYLEERGKQPVLVNEKDFWDYVEKHISAVLPAEPGLKLEEMERLALSALIQNGYSNRFPTLKATKEQIEMEIGELPEVQRQLDEIRQQLGGRNFDLVERYEENERRIRDFEHKAKEIELVIKELDKQLSGIDVHISKQPDPVYELAQKLPGYFMQAAEELLKLKKAGIEATMKEQLNRNLLVYQGQIDRVVFSDELRDLQFKLFHKAGNEIALSQLNTASKQIVVQCLLRALHEHGDYDPPVMIDTVMGVLDENSRNTVLEFYFPTLAHQTILFSSDSEIRISDVQKIQSFISQTYTLNRDIVSQRTDITKGYFNMAGVNI